jgi:hypothetical protein
MFKTSICSYPNRGHYGQSAYRGNCTGHIVRDFIESYMSRPEGLVVDPSVGGGTSEDVARELGVRFVGTDLHQGFNILRDDLATLLGEQAHLVWWHPPYWDMIKYSGKEWGEPNKWDMSRLDLPSFVEALELALLNIHDACEARGHYGILMGNMRRSGDYYNLSSLVERVAPGKLVDEIIKIQHNCQSDNRSYAPGLIRIGHEKLLVFRKDATAAAIFILGLMQRRAANMMRTTWRAAIRRILQGKQLPLDSIYQAVEPYAAQRANNHWQAKVRQVLQDERYFHRVQVGVYIWELAA